MCQSCFKMQSSVGKKRLCILCLTHPRGWTQNVTRRKPLWPARNQIVRRNKNVSDARVSSAKAPAAMMDGKVRRSQYSLLSSCVESFFRILVECKLEREQKQSIIDFWVLPSLSFRATRLALFPLYPAYSLFFGHTPLQSPPRHCIAYSKKTILLPTVKTWIFFHQHPWRSQPVSCDTML